MGANAAAVVGRLTRSRVTAFSGISCVLETRPPSPRSAAYPSGFGKGLIPRVDFCRARRAILVSDSYAN